jgi:hypothetical protein
MKISELVPDERNANKGTARGRGMLEKSMQSYGAGRSILIDKHNRIIAGNKTAETAGAIGIDDVQVVESDGRRIIAVKRTDLDLETDVMAKELAIADNKVAQDDLEWDADILKELQADGVNLERFFNKDEMSDILKIEKAAGTASDLQQMELGAFEKYNASKPFSFSGWTGGVIGVVGRKHRFLSSKFKVDIDFCLTCLLHDGIILIDNRYAFAQKRRSNVGGNSEFRSKEGYERDTEYIRKKWGKHLQYKVSDSGEITSVRVER